jgi:hypothetical protein
LLILSHDGMVLSLHAVGVTPMYRGFTMMVLKKQLALQT